MLYFNLILFYFKLLINISQVPSLTTFTILPLSSYNLIYIVQACVCQVFIKRTCVYVCVCAQLLTYAAGAVTHWILLRCASDCVLSQ